MYFLAMATDYDGTLARDGVVSEATRAALEQFKQSGRRLILITGRRLESVIQAFPQIELFERVVAENGAVIYNPATREERVIGTSPPNELIERLRARGVTPLHAGRSIIATWEPNEQIVLEEVRNLGLESQIIFNKGAVMVLPPGVNKATGLAAALGEIGVSPKNVIGVGDAENDHAFLRMVGCAAAVGNALPAVIQTADVKLGGDHGESVVELIEKTLKDDRRLIPSSHALVVGIDRQGGAVVVEAGKESILIAGKSGVGKSTLATALTERIVEANFGFCVIDPEGDYHTLEHSVCVGDAKSPPAVEEVVDLIRKIGANVVVNMHALALADRPALFHKLLPGLLSLRATSGRPHWVIVDEAHHLAASHREDLPDYLPDRLRAMIFVTVHPEAMSAAALQTIGTIIAVGDDAARTITGFCRAAGVAAPRSIVPPAEDEVVVWRKGFSAPPLHVKVAQPKQARERHKTKYAEGELGEDLSFYFRGEAGRLNLRAYNLSRFVELAQGVDADTWQFHRQRGEYSKWFKDVIKDEELAGETRSAEQDRGLTAEASRERIVEAVTRRYTAPAKESRSR